MPQVQRNVRILIVDDHPDSQRARQTELTDLGLDCAVRHPAEVEDGDFQDTDLVLVDYILDTWEERDEQIQLCLKPQDGLALTAILRSHLDNKQHSHPTAFALHTANLDRLARGMSDRQPCVLARLHDLEWVFSKAGNTAAITSQISSLASAVNTLPLNWPADPNAQKDCLRSLLKVPVEVWGELALEDALACYPPIHSISTHTHGLALIRWLLHRILSYPCFLLDIYHLAARLGVTAASLHQIFSLSKNLSSKLEQCSYKGILSSFHGNRWWKMGLNELLWNLTDGEPYNWEKVQGVLLDEKEKELAQPLPSQNIVVCTDIETEGTKDLIDASSAIRIRPDDWPPYADYAWVSIELARTNPAVQAIVVPNERDRLAEKR